MEKWRRYPLLIDSEGVVLSMPPIINSEATRVTSKTKNLFVDVTGEDERTVNQTLTILMTAFAERSFKLKSVRVKYPGRQLITPNLQPYKRITKINHANECIGLKLKPKEAAKIAERMRYGVVGVKGDTMTLRVPPYRSDLMHEVDLIEDIAVGYGYDKLEPTLPNVVTMGERAPIERLSCRARSVLTGLGFMEAMTYTLTNPRTNFEFMRTKDEAVTIANPVSDEYTIVRTSLLPSLLLALRTNKHHPLSQRVFEVGDVALLDEREETGAKKVRRVAAVIVDDRANLTDIRAVAEALLREFGVSPELRPVEHPSFSEGRAVEFIKGGKSIGIAGELHPEVILNFELEHPVAAFELTCSDEDVC
jgi:phenylalanyl-tRNA synthetase beta chain